jgi:rRNA maturation RNase YbeY
VAEGGPSPAPESPASPGPDRGSAPRAAASGDNGGGEPQPAAGPSPDPAAAADAGSDAAAPRSELLPLGDLVICAPVLAREAREQRKRFDAHWAHIVIHGVLHLLGYDHETEVEAQTMEDRERKILAGLGFRDPYALRN